MDLAIALLVFAVVFGLVYPLISRSESTTERAYETLRRMTRTDAAEEVTINRKPAQGKAILSWLYRLDLLRRLEDSLWQAGLYLRVQEVLLTMVLLYGAGAVCSDILLGDKLLSLGIGAGLAALPLIYIRMRKKHRLKAFVRQLPYALDILKSSLEAGHSLIRSMQVLVQEFNDPLRGEFRTVLEQARIGLPLQRALEGMLNRVPDEDLRMLVVAVKVQSEVGSSLAHIIGRLAEIVPTRQRVQAQIHALTAQSRMSGLVVGLLPVVMLAAFSVLQPDYTHLLFHEPAGLKLVKIAIALDAIAFVTIRRLLRPAY